MPLFQSEAKCKAIDMIFYSHANKIHFQKKGFELVLKVRVFELGNGLL